jgi:predicted trehalose synthase
MTVTADRPDRAAGDQATLQRAEEWVDRAVQDVTRLTGRLAARAREEAEDIWAEAEALNRSGPSPDDRA